jgi:hypothetical protein
MRWQKQCCLSIYFVCVCVCVFVLCIVTDSAVRLKLGHLVQKFDLGMHLIHVTYEFVGEAFMTNVMLKYSTIFSNTSTLNKECLHKEQYIEIPLHSK